MPDSAIGKLLQNWQRQAIEHHSKEEFPLALEQRDLIRARALAEVFQLPVEDVISTLLSTALEEAESKMPYIAGDKIIRVEEGEPIYEDIGLTPRYLAAKKQLERSTEKNDV